MKRNDKYWQDRALDRLEIIEKHSEDYLTTIKGLYTGARQKIVSQMHQIFSTYFKKYKLSPQEAGKHLTYQQSEELNRDLKKLYFETEDPMLKTKLLAFINAPAYQYRISRLNALLLNVETELYLTAPLHIKAIEESLTNTAIESFYRTMFDLQKGSGYMFSFNAISKQQIDSLIKEEWLGRHFSKSVWNNTDAIANKAEDIIKANVLSGRSWRRCIDEIIELVNTDHTGAHFAAERLLRTETNHIHNSITALTHIEAGFERYRFLATLDYKTSATCIEHDGLIDPATKRVYTYANRKEGENYPPLHPFCRSTAVGVFDEKVEARMKRTARDPLTGQMKVVPYTMTYKQWVKTLSAEQVALLKYWKESA